LRKLRSDLAYPKSRDFDDALFEALGLPLQENAREFVLITATASATPAPPLYACMQLAR